MGIICRCLGFFCTTSWFSYIYAFAVQKKKKKKLNKTLMIDASLMPWSVHKLVE